MPTHNATCHVCNTTFYRSKYRLKPGVPHYCTRACRRVENSRPCTVCSTPVYERPGRPLKHAYCSAECRAQRATAHVTLTCPVCSDEFRRYPSYMGGSTISYCSRSCAGVGRAQRRRDSHAQAVLDGTAKPHYHGPAPRQMAPTTEYPMTKAPAGFKAMSYVGGWVLEHRLLVAQALGRCLLPHEAVHHANHVRDDNRIENLMLFTSNQDHRSYEQYGAPLPVWCGKCTSKQCTCHFNLDTPTYRP